MATPKRLAVRAAKQMTQILEAVGLLTAEVAELKANIKAPDTIELTAEIDEATDRTDEILAAIQVAALHIGQQADQAFAEIGKATIAISTIADEMILIKAEIAQLKVSAPPPRRSAKK